MTDTRTKILNKAEQLFAKHGYEACSLRTISINSRVNQGLLHYHFGSKKNLFSEMFLRRARELVRQRIELLDEAEAAAAGRPVPVETLVRCFIEPPLRMLQGGPGERAFVRIHSQLRSDPVGFGIDLRRQAFGESTKRFIEAMRHSCPHLSAEAISWRFNSMIGAYLVVISHGARIEDFSDGLCSSDDIDAALRQILVFIVSGFNAPEPAKAAKPKQPKADRDEEMRPAVRSRQTAT